MTNEYIDDDMFDPEIAARAEQLAYEHEVAGDEAVAQFLQRLKTAYTRVFHEGNATADDVAFVMHDLAWFCKAHGGSWDTDPRQQDRHVARREVYERIAEYSSLSYDTLAKRYIEAQPKQG